MYVPVEIIVLFVIISFLVYTMPTLLVNFSHTPKGKLLLLTLTIVMTLYNRTAGIIMAMFFVFLSEFNYEFNIKNIYEGFTVNNQIDVGSVNYTLDPSVMVKKPKQDRLMVEEALMPIDSCTENV